MTEERTQAARSSSSSAVLSHHGGNKSNRVPFCLWAPLLYPPQQFITEEAEAFKAAP